MLNTTFILSDTIALQFSNDNDVQVKYLYCQATKSPFVAKGRLLESHVVGSSSAFYVILFGIGVLALVGPKMNLNLNLNIKRKKLKK